MRTTLTIDDQLAAALTKRAFDTGKPFKAVVNEALRAGLEDGHSLPGSRPSGLHPVSLGGPRPGLRRQP